MDAALNFDEQIATIGKALAAGAIVPYLGPEVPLLEAANAELPLLPEQLVARLVKRVAVPSRIRRNLTASAQYIENFRHRKTLRAMMIDTLAAPVTATSLHHLLAGLPLPLIVDTAYDGAMAVALKERSDWGQIQGVSRAEVKGDIWTRSYDRAGEPVGDDAAAGWNTVLYKPLGSISPAGNFIVSDSDYVEVLTEIDIQTPIPAVVQQRRSERPFVFLGCRFRDQLARTYARQVMKRSGSGHFAVIAEPLTRNEQKFVSEQGITVLAMPLADFVGRLAGNLPDAPVLK